MKLYEIDFAINELLYAVGEDGEIPESAYEQLDALLADQAEREESIGLFYKNLIADAGAIDEEIKRLKERSDRLKKRANRWKEYLAHRLNGRKIETPRLLISWRKSSVVQIDNNLDVYKLPDDCLRYALPTPDKAKLKQAIEAGAVFDGVSIVENMNMSIK